MEEFNPSSNERDDEDDNSDSHKKNKRAGDIGSVLFEPKANESEASEKDQSLWSQLTGGEKEPEDDSTVEALDEDIESDLPIDELTPAEQQVVEQAIAQENLDVTAEAGEAEAEHISTADEAVADFRERIVVGGQTAEEAFAETMQAIDTAAEQAPATSESDVSQAPELPQEFGDMPVEIPRVAPNANEIAEPQGKQQTRAEAEAEHARSYPNQTYYNGAFGTREDRKARREGRKDGDFGGTLDYLIGRRRGRIKAEKKLVPIQKKLEKQVKQLRHDIAEKETVIRQAAIEKLHDKAVLPPVTYVESAKSTRPKAEALKPQAQERRPTVEAGQLHGKVRPERIGQVLITSSETKPETVETTKAVSIDKHVETLTRADLLELSSKIVIEGATLKQAYETNLISEKGLRRLVAEHLRGGDIRRAIRREFVEHEIDFERDPMLRDRSRKTTSTNSSSSQLDTLLSEVDRENQTEAQAELAVLNARAKHMSKEQDRKKARRRAMDVSLVTTIIVLIALVVFLALKR